MIYDDIILDCIRYSPRITARSAAEQIGTDSSTFSKWRNWRNSHSFPSPRHIVKMADVSGHSVESVTFAMMAARAGKGDAARVFAELAA